MRGLPVRRIACTALCATLALGIAAPAAAAADPPVPATAPVTQTDVPGALPTGALPTSTAAVGAVVPAGTPVAAAAGGDEGKAGEAAAGPVSDALTTLQKPVLSLLAAATSDEPGGIVPAATTAVGGLVGGLAGLLPTG
ncbi:hypothetical protein [Streptomyces phaeofaciens]|uniref:hypothetical protein n=1 Tax=Streptomyces phaeofaciens TaxID=68254 RepID=UPI0036C73831